MFSRVILKSYVLSHKLFIVLSKVINHVRDMTIHKKFLFNISMGHLRTQISRVMRLSLCCSYVQQVAEAANKSPELIHLLELHAQFASITPYSQVLTLATSGTLTLHLAHLRYIWHITARSGTLSLDLAHTRYT